MRYSLDEIETFLTVMELGTVSAAAARLNLSKSVVSKRVSDFEATVGAPLFRRNAGRITPTGAAMRLSERLRPALAELVAAAESAAWGMDGATPLRGSLRIAAPMSFGKMHLPRSSPASPPPTPIRNCASTTTTAPATSRAKGSTWASASARRGTAR